MGSLRWASLPALLGCAYDVTVHDYSYFCPRIDLIDEAGRYCGEPDIQTCGRCIALNQPRQLNRELLRVRGNDGDLRLDTRVFLSSDREARNHSRESGRKRSRIR